jgi:hypothetical protein
MKVFVAGATGATGKLMVAKALADGHSVTALTRSGTTPLPAGVTRVVGAVEDPGAYAPALLGHDLLLSAVGSDGTGPTTVFARGVRALVEAASAAGIPRQVIITADWDNSAASSFFFRMVVLPLMLRHVANDQKAFEAWAGGAKVSGLTIVRPYRLMDAPATGAGATADGARQATTVAALCSTLLLMIQ